MDNYTKYSREVTADIEESLSKIAARVTPNSLVLDIGCSSGMMGRYLVREKACIVDGLDIDEQALENCKPAYRKIAIKNLEIDDLNDAFVKESYDFIIVADVIEHLNDPARLLQQLKLLVKPFGTIIFSVPNITHIAASLELLLGNFSYRHSGLLDSTHLRFYSYANLESKLNDSGLYTWDVDVVKKGLCETEFGIGQSKLFPQKWLDELIAARPDALVYQWIVSTKIYPCLEQQAPHRATKKMPLPIFTTALYWENTAGAGFNETDKILGIKASEIGRDWEIDFIFRSNPTQRIYRTRIDLVSEKKLVWIKSAKIIDAEQKVLWEWAGKAGHADIINAKWVDASIYPGAIISAENDDPQWYPEIAPDVLQRITAGAQCSIVMCDDNQAIGAVLADILSTQTKTANQDVSERDIQIAERDARIINLHQGVAERDGQIANLHQGVAERDTQISNLHQGVAERDTQISNLHQGVAERDTQIANLHQDVSERDAQIANLHQDISERDIQITGLNQSVTERQTEYQGHVVELEKAVWAVQQRYSSLVAETIDLRYQMDRIMSSRSWRVTAPLRKVMTLAHEIPRKISCLPLAAYRELPISPAQRQKLKNFLFVVFGFAFVRMDAYKRWKAYRQIQTEWPSVVPAVQMTSTSVVPKTFTALPTADGVWEWGDYDAVKSRISQIAGHQLSQVAPSPPDMIDIGNEPIESAASKVKLPAHPAEPDVSIIIPVFNNLKLTLECLLSISAHTDSRISFEIILADDASTDKTPQIVSKIANLRVIRNDQNLGFLRTCNKALEHVSGRYVIYLNNDVQVTRDWLVNLYETFTTQPNVGAVGPKFIYPSGHLQEAGVACRYDGTADMVGLNDDPEKPRYNYTRRVDYISGACLMLPTSLARQLGGFSEDFLPCYCEDSDLCMRVQDVGYHVYYNPASTIIHHLSKTTAAFDSDFKLKSISANLVKLQQKWAGHLDQVSTPKIIAFYLPQFHPIPENDHWWGNGFTEWTNVTKAQPNFVGHYQPRLPADLGFYDLRSSEVMQQQADLARRYSIYGFCFYYYWFGGKRLLEKPVEQMLATGKPDMPFCLCWANENWTRRWDGQDHEILIGQVHSPDDDEAVINDLIRYFRDTRYIRIDGRPMVLVYRVTLIPDFSTTVARWRKICREQGIGEIYVAMVESMELVHVNKHPREFGCDAAVEFPPLEMAEQKPPSGEIINPDFVGTVADYRDIAVRYATREFPGYTRFKGMMPGWDNTARRQNNSFCFEHATPGAFQAWLEETIDQTRQQHYGDERLVFVNAWNEWAEGAYLEPDRRFGHTYLEAVKNALEASKLLRRNKYWHGN